jgi:hypothetical protein
VAHRPNLTDRRREDGEGGARELAPKVRVPIWGIGGGGAHRSGLAAAKQVGGGEPMMAGRRSGGGRRLGVHGAAVSSGKGHCSDGEHVNGWRWRSTGRRPRQVKEAANSVLQRFLVADGGSVTSFAWLRGSRERCVVVSTSALGAEERGDEGAEMDAKSRVEWAGIWQLSRDVTPRFSKRIEFYKVIYLNKKLFVTFVLLHIFLGVMKCSCILLCE